MSAYDSLIARADAGALIPEEVYPEIFQNAIQNSAFLSRMRKLSNMSRKQERMPVLAALPTAFFRDGDTGLMQTSKVAWENKYLNAEPIDCIIPIPQVVLDDADYDIWGEVRPRIGEAIGIAVDQAIALGTNKPSTWPTPILTGATAAGNVVTIGTGTDLYDDILGEDGVCGTIEQDGYFVDGHIASLDMKSRLRGLRSADGVPIFSANMQSPNNYTLDGSPLSFPLNGFLNGSKVKLISGAFSQAVFSIRSDIQFKILTEAVIQDNGGVIIYNLAQQNMIALVVTLRLAWQIPNPINLAQSDPAKRYPFGILKTA
jgi:HK97 family phage major capsid protein